MKTENAQYWKVLLAGLIVGLTVGLFMTEAGVVVFVVILIIAAIALDIFEP